MRASLPALADISMSRSGSTIAAGNGGGSSALLPCSSLPHRFVTTTARHYTNLLRNHRRCFNFSSSFYFSNDAARLYSLAKSNNHRALVTATTAAGSSRKLSSSSKTALKNRRVDREVEEYWIQILQGVDKPTARRLIPYIDPSLPLGIPDPSSTPFSFSSSSSSIPTTTTTTNAALSSIDYDDSSPSSSSPIALRGPRPPMFSYFLQTKLEHPTKIILCRVGEFYETVGIDAILLVQHAGLNPMGKEGNTPRAGCPKANLRRTVNDLVHGAGLSVVVCEEVAEGYQYGMKKGPKQRYIADVVTPASPHYLTGLIDEDSDVVLDSAPPLLGVAPQVGGFLVLEIDAEMQTVRRTEGLTEDAVYARLHEGGLAPPLYVHTPPAVGASADRRLTEATSEVEWERRVSSAFRNQVGAVQRYDERDPVQGMIERVKRQLNLPPETVFRELPAASPKTRPRPLYFSTACNLGLHKTRGIPSLIDYALPAGAPLTARRWLRDLLLLPRPPAVSLAVHAACAALQNAHGPIPSFPVLIPNNVVLKIRNQQANDTFFRELGDLCRAVANACSNEQLEKFSKNVLVVAAEETGVELEINELATSCRDVLGMIHAVVDHDAVVGTGLDSLRSSLLNGSSNNSSSEDSDFEEEKLESLANFDQEERRNTTTTTTTTTTPNSDGSFSVSVPSELSAYLRMFNATEDFRGKIRPEKLKKALSAVEIARQRVLNEASKALSLAITTATAAGGGSSTSAAATGSKLIKPAFMYDVANNAAWLRFPRGTGSGSSIAKSASSKKDSGGGLIHPKDRNGKAETSFYSTADLETAQDDYRRACADARDAVRTELRKLAETLQPKLTQLVATATFAVVASALDAHIREAARRGWALPQLNFTSDAVLKTTTIDSGGGGGGSSRTTEENNSQYIINTIETSSSSTYSSSFKVDGMWPYWLGGTGGIDPGTIKNSFSMDGMFLLTGPNMAGKSTLLRSTCAVALLGASGLAVPASSSSTVPYFDAYMLRNFAADSPLEGKSSFAVEMNEMRYVLTDATERSLVLIDELGKGTEARAGAALAGSMLEALDETGCRGVFATHLHSLLDMDLKIPGTKRMMMEIEKVENFSDKEKEKSQEDEREKSENNNSSSNWVKRKATWRMVPGESTESLALEVAIQERLPQDVVDRAAHLYNQIMNNNSGDSGGGDSSTSTGDDSIFSENSLSSSTSATNTTSAFTPSTPPTPPSQTMPTFTLQQAAGLLETTASSVLQALTQQDSSTATSLHAQFVPVGMIPPVRTVGASCVYIARRSDGWYYVGSSDSLQDRIKAHRQRGGKSRVGDPKAEFAYVVVFDGQHRVEHEERVEKLSNSEDVEMTQISQQGVGSGSGGGAAGASAAKSVEAEVIRAMKDAGYPLLSESDARKRYAPAAISRYLNERSSRYS